MKKILGYSFTLISIVLITYSITHPELMPNYRWVLTIICSYLAYAGVSLLLKAYKKPAAKEKKTSS